MPEQNTITKTDVMLWVIEVILRQSKHCNLRSYIEQRETHIIMHVAASTSVLISIRMNAARQEYKNIKALACGKAACDAEA